MIPFVKAHGAGNDLVVLGDLDNRLQLSENAVRKICDRHLGIGADGLIRIAPTPAGTYFMDYRNADGSLAETCGNGLRVMGKWLGDRGYATDSVAVKTRAGIKPLQLIRPDKGTVTSVSVDMGPPTDEVRQVMVAGRNMATVSMGNPHAILFVDDVDAAPVAEAGPLIERHPDFPHGVNVSFVQHGGPGLRLRTWERGVGETLACGSAACATFVTAQFLEYCGATCDIEVRGGTLSFRRDGDSVVMTGPAVEVFKGEIDPVTFGIELTSV